MNPLVSVIIPVYNAAIYLGTCVESVIAQTWKNIEIIIVDDGSEDGSLQVARSYPANNIKVISQKNAGASAARNTGLKAAKGDYIQFLDADDLISPDKIEEQVHILNGSVSHLGLCNTQYFYDGEEHIRYNPRETWYYEDHSNPVDFLVKLYTIDAPGFGGMIQPNAWLTPRALIEKAGPWYELRSPDDDGELFCRVILASDGIRYSSKGMNYYRRYRVGDSLSTPQTLSSYDSMALITGLKYKYLKEKIGDCDIDKIFAQHYWRIALSAYPMFKGFSKQCISKARELGYSGKKYNGGPLGKKVAKYLGWKAVRTLVHYRTLSKQVLQSVKSAAGTL